MVVFSIMVIKHTPHVAVFESTKLYTATVCI
jgi:hypothetical protein